MKSAASPLQFREYVDVIDERALGISPELKRGGVVAGMAFNEDSGKWSYAILDVSGLTTSVGEGGLKGTGRLSSGGDFPLSDTTYGALPSY